MKHYLHNKNELIACALEHFIYNIIILSRWENGEKRKVGILIFKYAFILKALTRIYAMYVGTFLFAQKIKFYQLNSENPDFEV